jgi:hypothetical protein
MATAENDTATAADEVALEEPNFTEYRRFRETGDMDQAGKPVQDATHETSEAPGSDSNQAGSDGAAETPDTKQEGERSRRKPDAEKRIAQLTRQRRAAEDRANRLERELAELRQGKPEAKAPVKPKPEDFEDYDQFEEAVEKYREELIDWKVEQRLARQAEQARAGEQQKSIAAAWQQQAETAREKHDDFDEVLEANEQELPAHVMQTILESEVGAELAYYLGTHPDELTAIADMSPLKAVKALGVIETQLSTANRRPNTSKAPAPVRPVGGGKSAVTPESADNFETYKRLRRQQEQQAA